MNDSRHADAARQLALLRFAIIGDLLAAPPPRGHLTAALRAQAAKTWSLPDGTPIRFGLSTIETWFYKARTAADPVGALTSVARNDRGTRKAVDDRLLADLRHQYELHPSWTRKLHHKNLAALIRQNYADEYAKPPSYTTIRRVMRAQGWSRQRKPRSEGQARAVHRRATREVRSFESTHAHGLWHLDFHEGSRRVIDSKGTWHSPKLLAFLDDRTRLIAHAQWYLAEDTERLVHGFRQAVLKRGLPRAIMHDNGSAMRASEFQTGLADLGVESKPTLAYSPYQNGKKETFWAVVESQAIAMLDRVENLDLAMLNKVTQAWVECSYHREKHQGIGETPFERLEASPSVVRSAPTHDALIRAFTCRQTRVQRRSDGTISVEGVRFEIPSRLRVLHKLTVRYRRWNLSEAWIVDPRTKDVLARVVPVDLARNADARRKPLAEPDPTPEAALADGEDPIPPHLQQLLEDYAADGMPPAFLPLDDDQEET